MTSSSATLSPAPAAGSVPPSSPAPPSRPGPVARRDVVPGPIVRPMRRVVQSLRGNGSRIRRAADDVGMATAEYAIATLAACGFAGLLVAILSGGQVRGLLLGIIRRALSVG